MKREECERTFTDKMTGKRFDRPEFLKMLDMARSGDVIVVWRLDRLGRSLKDLIETVTLLQQRGIELRSLDNEGEYRHHHAHWKADVPYYGRLG